MAKCSQLQFQKLFESRASLSPNTSSHWKQTPALLGVSFIPQPECLAPQLPSFLPTPGPAPSQPVLHQGQEPPITKQVGSSSTTMPSGPPWRCLEHLRGIWECCSAWWARTGQGCCRSWDGKNSPASCMALTCPAQILQGGASLTACRA